MSPDLAAAIAAFYALLNSPLTNRSISGILDVSSQRSKESK